MGDQQNNKETIESNHSSAILKELSDIKASLAVNTNETANIKASISEIKGDMKEIKNDFVNRREFNEGIKSVREEADAANKAVKADIQPLKKFVYGVISIMGAVILGALLNQIIK